MLGWRIESVCSLDVQLKGKFIRQASKKRMQYMYKFEFSQTRKNQ